MLACYVLSLVYNFIILPIFVIFFYEYLEIKLFPIVHDLAKELGRPGRLTHSGAARRCCITAHDDVQSVTCAQVWV